MKFKYNNLERLSTEEIISLIDNLISKCVQFEILIEPKLFFDKEKIKLYCKEKSLDFRIFEDTTTIPITRILIRK